MPAVSAVVLLGCSAAHLALAAASPSPWWVPDLTLVGLVLSTGRSPARWLPLSIFAGLVTMVWAVRFPAQLFTTYLLVGWASQIVVRHWDATDVRIECLHVAVGSLVLMVGMVWLDDLWSPRLLVLTGVRAAVTCGVVPLVHQMVARSSGRAGAPYA